VRTHRKFVSPLLLAFLFLFIACTGDPQKAKAKYLAEGEICLKKGQFGDASIEFRNAVRLDPRSVEAYYDLAQADLAQHDWRAAYAALTKTIELDPQHTGARLDRGRLLLAARDFNKSEEDARFVLSKDPKNMAAYRLLGASLTNEQKLNEALDAYLQVVNLLASDPHSYVDLASIEIALQHLSDAEIHLKLAAGIDPKSVEVINALANLYLLENKPPQAEEALRAGVLNNPLALELYVKWASVLTNSGKVSEADGVLDKLRNKMPNSLEAAIAIGDYYAQRPELEKAVSEYKRGLSISAGNIDVEKRLEELYLILNRTDEAAKLDQQLAKQPAKDVSIDIAHGRLLLSQGKHVEALIVLQKAVTAAPDLAQAHYYLGLAYWQTGSIGQASSQFQQAAKLAPNFPLPLQSLVQLALSQNSPSQAEAYAQELVQKFPANTDGRVILGEILLHRGQPRLAEEQFIAAGRIAPKRADLHMDLGRVYAAETKMNQAEHEFETAAQLDPSNTSVLASHADVLVARQQRPRAIAMVQEFVDAHPDSATAHLILGTLQADDKNIDAARAELEVAIRMDATNIQSYLQLARVYQAQNQTEAAIRQYHKALALQPNSAAIIALIGNLYLDEGHLDSAREYFTKALVADPDFAIANANLAWVDAQEGKDLDAALEMARKAKSELPDVPSITDTLAWVMYKKGDYSGAILGLQDCVKKVPDSAQYRLHLGLALIADGKKGPGSGQLETALHLNNLSPADKEQAQRTLAQAKSGSVN
jgi:tetratricopeptide (TPR) repeat protein